ncbi:MAG: hypothetical protein GY751_10150, partial [Bacteroidetes bacterium]|nr:hypothetical protein [Bacteroidota bacterium]
GNGLQDAGEPGIENVTVTLTGTTGNGSPVTELATTDIDGLYLFENIYPGDYTVHFDLPAGFAFTYQSEGSDDTIDSDADETTGNVTGIVLISSIPNLTIDAGMLNLSNTTIGDYVWLDCDKDGIQDSGEQELFDVPVNLSGFDGIGNPVNLSTTTDAFGYYEFANLKPGRYVLSFGYPPSPTGLQYAPQDQGFDDDLDSDVNEINGETSEILVISGVANNSIDAGFIDAEAPQFTVEASDNVVECDGSGNSLDLQNWLDANGGAIATDNVSESSAITWTNDFSALSDECGETGEVIVIFTASDECGNSNTTSATFTIQDTESPTFADVPVDITIECDESLDPSLNANLNEPSSFNDTAIAEIYTLSLRDALPICPQERVITREWTAT